MPTSPTRKAITPAQREAVFSVRIHPNHPAIEATMAYFGSPPKLCEELGISPDRGGKDEFYQATVSIYGDGSRRVVGIRVRDKIAGLLKEDHYVLHLGSLTMDVYPKGSYQRENKLYADTHHR